MGLLRHVVPRNDKGGAIATFFIVIASGAWQSRDWDCFGTLCLAMTEGVVIASLFYPSLRAERGNLESKILNPKSEILNNIK